METQGCCGFPMGGLIDKRTTQYLSQKVMAFEKAAVKGVIGFVGAVTQWIDGQNSHRAFDKDPQVRAEAKAENTRLSKEIVTDLAVGYAGGKLLGMGAKALSGSAAEVSVFRVYGQDAKADGFSWSPVNPNSVGNYRDAAGLPSGGANGSMNSGQFVIEGTVKPNAIITNRAALPLDGNKGGVPEYIINPKNVTPKRVSGANPNF
ncbi:hypothetical protein NAF17_08230 [Mucilaginibacter sp. RB4R14]|uniref:hypothetical protein n=1 Tax=Mucilaginibacter aurantiaciroseus TaxID=2949308 RepID=UPI0020907BCB|nr:hypothetical protein [Mucilaginibacter aurantiaciroseus]MCO5935526.1 hypothetical protein [Mucilaginibacter aurantiaciroseus]